MSSPSIPDRTAFETLYDELSREVWAVAYSRWCDRDLATDIMQEAFLRLWKQWEQGEIIHNTRAWLIRVARNLAEDSAKSAFRRNGTQPPDLLNGVAQKDSSPIERMVQDELSEEIREILAEMSPGDREILTMRYALDYDTPTIAERLNVNPTAIHMRLSRARARLAEKLSNYKPE